MQRTAITVVYFVYGGGLLAAGILATGAGHLSPFLGLWLWAPFSVPVTALLVPPFWAGVAYASEVVSPKVTLGLLLLHYVIAAAAFGVGYLTWRTEWPKFIELMMRDSSGTALLVGWYLAGQIGLWALWFRAVGRQKRTFIEHAA